MVFLQISSTNPKLGYVIKKNPNSLPIIKQLKSGFAFGYYTHVENKILENEYNIYFQEKTNNVSYKESDDENMDYTDKMRFMAPQCVLDLLDSFLNTTLRTLAPEDEINIFNHKFTINLIWIKQSSFRLFISVLDSLVNTMDINYLCTNKGENTYSLEISTKQSIKFLLNVVQVLVIFINLKNKIWPQIIPDSINAKLKVSLPLIVNNIPYRFAYVLLSSIDNKTFKMLAPHLKTPNITYFYGRLSERRFGFVLTEISRSKQINNIIDIGAGEGKYLDILNKIKMNTKNINYWCLDIDPVMIKKLEAKKLKMSEFKINVINTEENKLDPLANILSHSDDVFTGKNNIIIMVEVIEHMDLCDAQNLLTNTINKIPFNKLIVTTPDRDFNVNYNMETQFRHNDHKFEFNGQEFKDFINLCCNNVKANIIFFGIGDIVNEISPTQCAVINKINT